MNIGGEKFTFVDTIETPIAVADSWVKPKNKIGDGNGEAKLYVGNRDSMEKFFGGQQFTATCFILRSLAARRSFFIRISTMVFSREAAKSFR